MNIVDALIQKGSTGGNNIAEAIENLPVGGSGGTDSSSNVFVINFVSENNAITCDTPLSDVIENIVAGRTVIANFHETYEDDGDTISSYYTCLMDYSDGTYVRFKHESSGGNGDGLSDRLVVDVIRYSLSGIATNKIVYSLTRSE